VDVADLDKDGHLDLVVAGGAGADDVTVLLGDGNGYFPSSSTSTVGSLAVAVATGDFDQDTYIDVAVANWNSGDVSILLWDSATDELVGPTDLDIGGRPNAISELHFNGDALLGNGLGQLVTPTHYTVGANPTALTGGDLDEDGHLDLVVANEDSDNVTLLLWR
jgi:hypothetical protein